MESKKLIQQVVSNTNEQFANSPDLSKVILNAIIGTLDAHNEMSSQAFNSQVVRDGLKEILIEPSKRYERLSEKRSA